MTTASDTQAAQSRDSVGAGAARPGTAGGSPAGTSRVSVGAAEVNGTDVSLDGVPANWTLADLLRYRTSLRGTHLACEHGVCGVCTVLLDGDPVRSCLVLSHAVRDRQVTTVEGLDLLDAGLAQRLRAAFVARNAFQCGFCTPGMLALVFSAARVAAGQGDSGAGDGQPQRPDVSRRAREVIDANICRCTGYSAIVAAATDVLQEPGGGGIADRAG